MRRLTAFLKKMSYHLHWDKADSLRPFSAGTNEMSEGIDHVQTPLSSIPHIDGYLCGLKRAELVKIRHRRKLLDFERRMMRVHELDELPMTDIPDGTKRNR